MTAAGWRHDSWPLVHFSAHDHDGRKGREKEEEERLPLLFNGVNYFEHFVKDMLKKSWMSPSASADTQASTLGVPEPGFWCILKGVSRSLVPRVIFTWWGSETRDKDEDGALHDDDMQNGLLLHVTVVLPICTRAVIVQLLLWKRGFHHLGFQMAFAFGTGHGGQGRVGDPEQLKKAVWQWP